MTSPTGINFIKSIIAAPFNSTTTEYIVDSSDSTALFINDPVRVTGQTDDEGVEFCTKASPGEFLRGIVVGFVANHDYEDDIYRRVSTRRRVYVCHDPFLISRARVNSAIATSDIGKYIDIDSGGGNTATGISEINLDYATINTTSGQFKILKIENVDTTEDETIVLVAIAKHDLLRGVAGSEDFWDRTGATIIPHFSGDDLNMGAGDITATNGNFTGKLTVAGLIDPTALILDPQASAPATDDGTVYYDSGTSKFTFRENGTWVTYLTDAAENLWDRSGTTLEPHFSGDDIDLGTGNITATDGTLNGKLTTDNIEHAGSALTIKNDSVGNTGVEVSGNGANYSYLRLISGSDPNSYAEYRQDNASFSRINFGTNITTFLINGSARPIDVRIAGDTDVDLFHLDGANDRIGISTSGPTNLFHVDGDTRLDDLIFGGTSTATRITTTGTQFINLVPTNGNVTIGVGSAQDQALNFDNTYDGKILFRDSDGEFDFDAKINVTQASSGKYIGFSDGTDTFGIYNYAGSPEGNIAANIGSICTDTSNGDLYVKSTDTVNTGWRNVGPDTTYSTVNVSNPPTEAELNAAFGAPATVGAGFTRIINDNGGGINVYYVVSTGSSWFYTTLGKATT